MKNPSEVFKLLHVNRRTDTASLMSVFGKSLLPRQESRTCAQIGVRALDPRVEAVSLSG
jgi:hypothetical protein